MRKAFRTDDTGLGTSAVFLTAISTILGAIMFLRFGYAVGHTGLFGVWAIIIIGHLVTIPTAMAIAEIATNQKVEGGGEYYIVSRSFGIPIGASIGIGLYMSQAISVAFYLIAFAQAFDPVFAFVKAQTGIAVSDPRLISVPALVILTALMLIRGAGSGASLMYFIVAVIFVSLTLFFLGSSGNDAGTHIPSNTIKNPDSFFKVFAIVFPAFTGMTAGVGLSGDLKDPKKAIPLGTLGATLIGMIIYLCIAYKLFVSAKPEDLAADQLIMSKIAVWGPIIPIGLACATISSALGSIMVAPRTMQALAHDRIFINGIVNSRLAQTSQRTHEPRNAVIATSLIAFLFIMIGDVNIVAEIISMFFMVTYGSLCLISFLEHFAADPSYRPKFKSRWYLSLLGALLCFWLMFQMQPLYAGMSLVVMTTLYIAISRYNPDKRGMAAIFQGVIFQLSRQLQVFLQKANKDAQEGWRPSVVCLSGHSFDRFDAFDMLRWISHRYGFGTYIHLIKGYLSRQSRLDTQDALHRLIRIANISDSNVYFDTIVSPSYTTAVAQVLQLPGISGKENNTILFEYTKTEPEGLADIIDNFQLIKSTDFNILILAASQKKFGYRREIHIWITSSDYANANLMILLAYIIMGHPDWEKGVIKIFDICPMDMMDAVKEKLMTLIHAGRLPISPNHIEFMPHSPDVPIKDIINEKSQDADLTIIGFRGETVKHGKSPTDIFEGYDKIGNILFVNTTEQKEIK